VLPAGRIRPARYNLHFGPSGEESFGETFEACEWRFRHNAFLPGPALRPRLMSPRSSFGPVLILLVPLFAGCLSSPPEVKGLAPIDLSTVVAPGGLVERVEDAVRVVWTGPLKLEKPFSVRLPPGVTRVDATLTRDDDAASSLALYNERTGRIRCQPDRTLAWFTPMTRVHRCSGLAAVDPLPTSWRTAFASLLERQTLEIRLTNTPLDGQAALLHLDQLSMPRLKERPTEITTLSASSDGARLHVEVTRPDTSENVPAIIVSSPYNQATRLAGLRPENSTIADWVPRGYAVVTADVRGFALSEGCIEVWGPKEQQDQVDLVEWVAAQPWSNGKVGFYGQSYVGTTPVEAAVHAPPHLTTIIAVAPVINAYEDWHFGGVPNGENTGSPVFYQYQDTGQFLDATLAGADPQTLAQAVAQSQHGFCDPTLTTRANDPRALYDAFYHERDFKSMAKNVQASVFYTQGFYDTNVKSQMIPGWFNALQVPKKGLFGDWVHQHPPRADQELLFHAWFDEWLLGRDTGILDTPVVEVRTNVDTVRTGTAWPPAGATPTSLGLDLGQGRLVLGAAGNGVGGFLALPSSEATPQAALVLEGAPLAERLYVSGLPELRLRASLTGGPNAHLYASVEDVAPGGARHVLTFGMLNLAHNRDHTAWQPVPPNEARDYVLPFLATEYVVEPGHRLVLTVRAASNRDWAGGLEVGVPPASLDYLVNAATGTAAGSEGPPAQVTLEGASSALVLPTLLAPGDTPAPGSAGPAPLRRAA
jgi:uncharacterized protein